MTIEKLENQVNRIHTEADLALFLDELEQELGQVTIAYTQAQWERFSGKNPSNFETVENKRATLFCSSTIKSLVLDWMDKVESPTLQRRLVLLERKSTEAQVNAQPETLELSNGIMAAINGFRPQIEGDEMDRARMHHILHTDADRERRQEAWQAENSLGEQVEPQVGTLIQHRNDLARQMGYESYVELALSIQGIDPSWLQDMLHQLETLTAEPYADLLERIGDDLGLDKIQAWDVPYGLAQMAGLPDDAFPRDKMVEWAVTLAESLGFQKEAIDAIQIDIADLPYSGLCFGIDLPGDVRILTSLQDGHRSCAAFFHEFGHALHYTHVDQPTYSLKYGLAGCFDEGMARFFESFAEMPEWLGETLDLSDRTIKQFCAAQRAATLYKLRGSLAQTLFEFEAYANPDQELQSLWQTVRDCLMLTDSSQAPNWAANPFYTMFPMYVQNYVVADVISAQTHATLRQWIRDHARRPQVAKLLIGRYYSPGASVAWPEKVQTMTGKKPDSIALANQLSSL